MHFRVKIRRDMIARPRSIRKSLALVLSISAFPIGLVVIASSWKEIPFSLLMRDVGTIGHLPFYAGFLSQIGLFVWVAALSVTLFTSLQLRERRPTPGLLSFMLASSALTFLLLLDDAFLLHESVYPSFGMPEKLVYLAYLGMVGAYLSIFWRTILRTEFIYLLLAFLFLGLSMTLDAVNTTAINPYLLEDGLKFVGLVSWMIYFWNVAGSEWLHPVDHSSIH